MIEIMGDLDLLSRNFRSKTWVSELNFDTFLKYRCQKNNNELIRKLTAISSPISNKIHE